MALRPDDEIALEIGRKVVAWMRQPLGRSGTLRVMGDDTWRHGYDVTVALADPPRCVYVDCNVCRPS